MSRIAIVKTVPEYPFPPFSPSVKYPEYEFEDLSTHENHVYESVRRLLIYLELDRKNIGKKTWNPLNFIDPGDTVVIKPNLVIARHFSSGNVLSVITHASVLRPLLDFTLIALKGSGKVLIADSPERMADFDLLLEKSGIRELVDFYKRHNIEVEVRDLRWEMIKYGSGAIVERRKLQGDPEGYRLIDLGRDSAFHGLTLDKLSRLYGADYNRKETVSHHSGGRHEYELANTMLKADVIISVPKLKTHKKAGVSLNLKGFIGCTGNKNLVPHRTLGDPTNGGDSYPLPSRTRRGMIVRKVKDVLQDNLLGVAENKPTAIAYTSLLRAFKLILKPPRKDLEYGGGQWYGNDTLWRGIVDLTRIILFADKKGQLRTDKQRSFFSVVDGVYAADRNGPAEPRLRREGIVLGGSDPVELDFAAVQLMGFDYRRVSQFSRLLDRHRLDVSLDVNDLAIVSNVRKYEHLFDLKRKETLGFEPPKEWEGKIELSDNDE